MAKATSLTNIRRHSSSMELKALKSELKTIGSMRTQMSWTAAAATLVHQIRCTQLAANRCLPDDGKSRQISNARQSNEQPPTFDMQDTREHCSQGTGLPCWYGRSGQAQFHLVSLPQVFRFPEPGILKGAAVQLSLHLCSMDAPNQFEFLQTTIQFAINSLQSKD